MTAILTFGLVPADAAGPTGDVGVKLTVVFVWSILSLTVSLLGRILKVNKIVTIISVFSTLQHIASPSIHQQSVISMFM